MTFEEDMQQWVTLDNQLKQINEKVKEIRLKKNKLEENITNYASDNNLSNSVFKISDGRLKITNTRVAEPITLKYLDKTLNEVIKNDSHVKLIMEHIKTKRAIKIIAEIKRIYNN
jgi:hypothetical protein